MTSYLLLRNNKESGPHTFEQLLGFNLKPYDLVWVNGKSAAWRYPSEIEELKSYAPGEVEQPFDRFFKKPTETNLPLFPETKPVQQQVPDIVVPSAQVTPMVRQEFVEPRTVETPVVLPQPVEEVKHVASEFNDYEQQYIPKKSVYVTMPGQRAGLKPEEQQKTTTISPEPVLESRYVPQQPAPVTESKYIPREGSPVNESRYMPRETTPVNDMRYAPKETSSINESRYTPDHRETSTPTVSISENPVTAQIKYSQPLDEIKEMYVKTLQNRKDKMARQAFFKVNLKRVAVIAGLIGIGGLAGYIIKSGAAKKGNIIAAQQVPAVNPALNTSLLPNPDPDTNRDETPENSPVENKLVDEAINRAFKKPEQPVTVPIQQDDVIKDKPAGKTIDRINTGTREKVAYSPVETNNQTGERSRTVRTEESATQDKIVNNNNSEETRPVKRTSKSVLGSQVFVTTNDYKRVAFGGIRNLELTVTNNSKYELDNVLVELEYLKPSEESLRTESIRFNNIAPNEAATIRIPDTNRGIKVKYRIISIGSKQLNADLANN